MLFLNKKYAKSEGFTLIELCFALILIGVLMVPAIAEYDRWERTRAKSDTINKVVVNLPKAFADYFYQFGHYPCPADPTLLPGQADHGRQSTAICTSTDPVISGAIPFAELSIPYDLTLDGWSNQMRYSVTRSLTTGTIALPSQPGSISVTYLNNDGTVQSTNNVIQLVIWSGGLNASGVFTADGVRDASRNCPTTGVIPQEAENCDDDASFIQFLDQKKEIRGNNASYYDDVVQSLRSAQDRVWTNSSADETDIFSKVSAIGIGDDTPDVHLDVNGNIRAVQGSSNTVCDANGSNCFNPSMIGGSLAAMDCATKPNSGPMVRIRTGQAECGSAFSFPITATSCTGTGQYVRGFDAAGGIICGTP